MSNIKVFLCRSYHGVVPTDTTFFNRKFLFLQQFSSLAWLSLQKTWD